MQHPPGLTVSEASLWANLCVAAQKSDLPEGTVIFAAIFTSEIVESTKYVPYHLLYKGRVRKCRRFGRRI